MNKKWCDFKTEVTPFFKFHNTGSWSVRRNRRNAIPLGGTGETQACIMDLPLLCRIEESLDTLLRSLLKLFFVYTYF